MYRVFRHHPEQISQRFSGVRSQREPFRSFKVESSLQCMVFCVEEKTCKSLNYAEYIDDGQENCELHKERNDENSLELKDDKYTFYQVDGELQESEDEKTTENATEKVCSIMLHRKQSSALYGFLLLNNVEKYASYIELHCMQIWQ